MKKTCMPIFIERLGYIKCYSSSSPRSVKRPGNSIRQNYQKIWSWSRRPKTVLEIRSQSVELRTSVKVCKWDLITFVRISKSWHAFDESRFDVSFSISGFEILKYLILKHLFVLVLLIGSSLWSIFPGL